MSVNVFFMRMTLGLCLALLSCGQQKKPPKVMRMNPFSEQSDLTDVEKEFLRLSTLAVKGDAKAQTSLAHKYALGKGVEKDMNEAVRWYRVAGNQGEAEAQFNLGYMYYNGEGLPRDFVKAVEWFRKSAAQGNAGAQGSLGLMYDNGEGVAEDNEEA